MAKDITENLEAFLADHAIQPASVEYVASKRFVGADGSPVAWKIKPITNDENKRIADKNRKKSLVPGTRETQITLDQEQYANDLICACVVHPNLNSAALQESYAVVGAGELVRRMLTAGEYQDLFQAVMQANDFETGMAEKIKIAKN